MLLQDPMPTSHAMKDAQKETDTELRTLKGALGGHSFSVASILVRWVRNAWHLRCSGHHGSQIPVGVRDTQRF